MAACSICNDPVLIAALKVALGNAPAPSGNVDSIICNPPLTASTPTGDVTIELPISGTWSATNNVVLGSSATALEWGTDATSPAPVVVTTNYSAQANIYFNTGVGSLNINSVTYSDINSKSATYSQVSSIPFEATGPIVPATGASCGFLLNIAFPIIAGMTIPASVVVGNNAFSATVQIGNSSLTPNPPYQVPVVMLFNNLTCAASDNVSVTLVPFTLTEGM